MPKRVFWLLLTAVSPLFILSFLLSRPGMAQGAVSLAASHDIIINEWSQGNGGYKEWVELLVVNGPIDMRGWDLGDSTPGDLVFADAALWSNIPAGSLIVVYNGSDRDTLLPPDDADLADCVAVVSDENAAYFSSRLPAFTNDNSDDVPHLRDQTDVTIHNFSAEPGGGFSLAANETARYDGNTAAGVSAGSNWSVISAGAATPGAGNGGANTAWIDGMCGGSSPEADLTLNKTGPATAVISETIVYQISFSNAGSLPASGVILTDTLPAGLSYVSDDSGYALDQPGSNRLVWSVGTVPTGTPISFNLTATIGVSVSGSITNQVAATTAVTETNLSNNSDTAVTAVSDGTTPAILIDAVLFDGLELDDLDEAVQLRNVGNASVDIGGWQLFDGTSKAVIPANTTLAPDQTIWLAHDSVPFARQFGFLPDFEVTDSNPAVPDLSGAWPGFTNSGDEVFLLDPADVIKDVLVYEGGATSQSGEWVGPAVALYHPTTAFATKGQILYRRRDQVTGAPVPDTNTAADWAQATDDVITGRKVRYPGWDLDAFFFTAQMTETAVLTVAIAPDNAYQAIEAQIDAAQATIQIETQTFENIAIGDALVRAANRGVSVTVLLEGRIVGQTNYISDEERYNCQRLENANGQCWFMINDEAAKIFDRYSFLHAKFLLIDGERVIVSSENLSPNSLPDDDKSDGTWGRRGVVLITDAPGVVSHVQTIFNRDFDPANHIDLFRWQAGDPTYGSPPGGFVPITQTGGITYAVRYTTPAVFSGAFAFELVQSPENSLRDQDGLLGLINRAGSGDTILVQQLEERPYWGASASNPTDDPNPRLEAYINAARRGAAVRLLLDAYFDEGDATSNAATCQNVKTIAQDEGLSLECVLGNPAGLGIHNKMVLAQINGRGYIHIGSINGTETSSKSNRELALQLQSDGAYALLAEMFERDWPFRAYLPAILNNYIGPANHVLISEVLYDSPGQDDAEFIELVNPTGSPIDLSNYSLGDAVNRSDFEDVRRFPGGATIAPQATLVIAATSTGFEAEYGTKPDYEILNTDPLVPDLIDDTSWGDTGAYLQLGNSGDEIILRDAGDQVVDAVAYGTGSYPGVTACPLVVVTNASLERHPYWRDTDACEIDFRENPFPSPAALPE